MILNLIIQLNHLFYLFHLFPLSLIHILFESITHIVDEVFNNYVVKDGQIQPYFTKYCDGKKTICEGLSQWGTVTLAKQGKTTLQILKYYYGDDIKIITDTKTIDPIYSYPGVTLKLGDAREEIRIIQRELNVIHQNYHLLPCLLYKSRCV